MIEYQSGIVFLTTNRLNDIDSAFESRLHLNIIVPELELGIRKIIWKNLASKNGAEPLGDKQLAALSAKELNGRQIKNILRLAHLIAANRMREEARPPGGEYGDRQGGVECRLCYKDI